MYFLGTLSTRHRDVSSMWNSTLTQPGQSRTLIEVFFHNVLSAVIEWNEAVAEWKVPLGTNSGY